MAIRTNGAAVKAILDTDLTASEVEDAFIPDASGWIDDNLTGKGIGSGTLTTIEKYLAAHFVTARDPRTTEEKLGDARERLQRDTKVSEYLKIAAGLDPTGTVEDQFMPGSGRPKVKFRVGAGYDSDLDLPDQNDGA